MREKAIKLTYGVIEHGLRLHREVGPGLLETVYEQVLADRLAQHGHKIDRQQPVSVTIDGKTYPDAFRFDLLVDDCLLLEIKSIEKLGPIHIKQTLTYLRMMNLPVGLILNFGCETLKQGIRQVLNDYTRT